MAVCGLLWLNSVVCHCLLNGSMLTPVCKITAQPTIGFDPLVCGDCTACTSQYPFLITVTMTLLDLANAYYLCLQYLGNDLEDVRGRTIFEDSSIVTLPLILLPGVVLVPGQVIPLQLYTQRLVAVVRKVADKDKTFGVVNLRYH